MAYSAVLDVRITDSCLRDGSHAIRHQFTEPQVRAIVRALDEAHVPVIEVTHGDGLGGSSFNYGFSAVDEITLIKAAGPVDFRCCASVSVCAFHSSQAFRRWRWSRSE